MSPASLHSQEAGRWRLSGVLDFMTVVPLAAQGRALMARDPAGAEIDVDLSEVELANSAGLALLLEWLEAARARGIRLTYSHLPDSLRRIADFSNLQSLLPADF